MLSTPPAMYMSPSPTLTARAASTTACRPLAQAVDGHPGRRRRQAGEQRGEARDVARILACLVDAAEHDVADLGRVDLVARHHFPDHLGGEVVGAQRRELAGVAADGAAQTVVNVGI